MIRSGGVAALTRAAVAGEAGVSTRATYRLAQTTDDLVALAVNEWQRAWAPPTDTGEWRADLVAWCEDTLAHMRDHRGLVAASQQISPARLTDAGRPVVDAAAALLVTRAGVDDGVALDVVGVLGMHCLAWELTISSAEARFTERSPGPDSVTEHLAFLERGFRRGIGWILDGAVADGESGS